MELCVTLASSSTDTTDVPSNGTSSLPAVTVSDTDSDNTASAVAAASAEPAAETCNSSVAVDEETTGKSLSI